MIKSLFEKNIIEHKAILNNLYEINNDVVRAGKMASDTLLNGGKIFLCGNGGSAADSQHIAAELTGRFISNRKALAALSLSTDTSALTCISNDYSFEEVFSRQLEALGRPDDLLIGISTSGNSQNVFRCIETARKMNIRTIGLLGCNGGIIRSICDVSIVVPSTVTARIQEMHILIGHTLCGLIEIDLGVI